MTPAGARRVFVAVYVAVRSFRAPPTIAQQRSLRNVESPRRRQQQLRQQRLRQREPLIAAVACFVRAVVRTVVRVVERAVVRFVEAEEEAAATVLAPARVVLVAAASFTLRSLPAVKNDKKKNIVMLLYSLIVSPLRMVFIAIMIY